MLTSHLLAVISKRVRHNHATFSALDVDNVTRRSIIYPITQYRESEIEWRTRDWFQKLV